MNQEERLEGLINQERIKHRNGDNIFDDELFVCKLVKAILKEYIHRDDVEKVSVIGLQRKFKVGYHEAMEMIRYFKKGLTAKE